MKIGYPCKNWTIGCSGDKTFRLKSYSEQRLIKTVTNNLDCLKKMLEFNVNHHLFFFRITSDLIPFASHPICTFNWKTYFADTFDELGSFIKKHDIRISMHPDQFIVINSPKHEVVTKSIAELQYHANVLDAMNLSLSSKIQLHVGGVYTDKKKSIHRFIRQYTHLPTAIKNRLVIENDDTRFSTQDCLDISDETSIPVLVDVFHHTILNKNEGIRLILKYCMKTWKKKDGLPMVDYSQQEPNRRKGKHAETINLDQFQEFIETSKPYDFDIMLEIKDKEKSAHQAFSILKDDPRFFK